jgi:hypothetical protein
MATVQGSGGVDESCWSKDRGWGEREWREYPKKTGRWKGNEYFASSPIQSWSQFGAGLFLALPLSLVFVVMGIRLKYFLLDNHFLPAASYPCHPFPPVIFFPAVTPFPCHYSPQLNLTRQ